MLVLRLLSHGWKQSLRSANRGQNTVGNIIVLVLFILLGVNLLGLGLFLHELLKDLEPGVDPLEVFNGWVVYYLGIDLLLRQLMQRIPGQTIVPYLTLRIKKSLLVHLLLVRSFFSLFNLLPWVIIIPFAVNAVFPSTPAGGALGWLVAMAFLIAASSLLNLSLKKLSVARRTVALGLGGVLVGAVGLDLVHVIVLPGITKSLLGGVLAQPWYAVLVALVPAALYVANFRALRNRMRLEDLSPGGGPRTDPSVLYRLLESAGERGRYCALELKLFVRNRRARASLIMAIVLVPLSFLFYGVVFQAEGDPYPIPSAEALEAARQVEPSIAPPGYVLVTFRLDSGVVPSFAHPYVTGDRVALGKWRPGALPLLPNPDSSWSRSFLIERGSPVRYCFTLGAWQTEERVGDGSESPVQAISALADTTIRRGAVVWKTPELPMIIMINLLYWGLLVTGILFFAYGQFFLAWDSTFFDALLTWRLRFRWILQTKAWIMFVLAGVSFLLTVPYVFIDSRILLVNTLAFVYNIGVNTYVLIYLASKTKKRFELNESIFSQQGKGAAQFVAILPMWILPLIVYGVAEGFGIPYAEYLVFGGLGVLGLVLQRPLMGYTFSLLENSRYEVAAGFRQGGTV